MMDGNGQMSTSGWIFAIVAMIIVLTLIVTAAVWIARQLGSRQDGRQATTTAWELLDRRLANDGINAEQYEHLRRALAVDSPPAEGPVQVGG